MSNARSEVTQLLSAMSRGQSADGDTGRLLELVYEELRDLAGHFLRKERVDHTLQPTALVHEAYLKLVGPDDAGWKDRAHFMRVAARAMRQILIDHARRRNAVRRGGGWNRVTFDDALNLSADDEDDILALNEALERFASVDERAARVVELRIFGGMTVRDVAHVLEVSPRTVDGDWAMALMWLGRELGR